MTMQIWKSSSCLAIIFHLALPVVALADSSEKKVPAKGLYGVKVDMTSGGVRAMAWNGEYVTVQWNDDPPPPIQLESNWLKIGRPSEKEGSGLNTDIKIFMPEGLNLTIQTIGGRITAQGLIGRSQLVTVSGNVKVSSCAGPVGIKTVSGDIDVREVKSDVSLNTVSGEIDVRNLKSSLLEAKSVSGDLRLRSITAHQLRLSNHSGDILFSGTISKTGALEAKNFGGIMEFMLPAEAEFNLEAKARYGKVRVQHSLTSAERANNWVRGQAGAGGPIIRLSSYSGDIFIRSAKQAGYQIFNFYKRQRKPRFDPRRNRKKCFGRG